MWTPDGELVLFEYSSYSMESTGGEAGAAAHGVTAASDRVAELPADRSRGIQNKRSRTGGMKDVPARNTSEVAIYAAGALSPGAVQEPPSRRAPQPAPPAWPSAGGIAGSEGALRTQPEQDPSEVCVPDNAMGRSLDTLPPHLFMIVMQQSAFETRAILGRVNCACRDEFNKQFRAAILEIMKTAPELFSEDKLGWRCYRAEDKLGFTWQQKYSQLQSERKLPDPARPSAAIRFDRYSDYSLGIVIRAEKDGRVQAVSEIFDLDAGPDKSALGQGDLCAHPFSAFCLHDGDHHDWMKFSLFILRKRDQKIFLLADDLRHGHDKDGDQRTVAQHGLTNCYDTNVFNVPVLLGGHFYCDLEIVVGFLEFHDHEQYTDYQMIKQFYRVVDGLGPFSVRILSPADETVYDDYGWHERHDNLFVDQKKYDDDRTRVRVSNKDTFWHLVHESGVSHFGTSLKLKSQNPPVMAPIPVMGQPFGNCFQELDDCFESERELSDY